MLEEIVSVVRVSCWPQVRVLFSQPTSVAMLPCKFFLQHKCRFSEETCQFSHGYELALADLEPYW